MSEEFLSVPPKDHFIEVVRAYEINPEEVYINSIEEIKNKNLKSLNGKDIDSILKSFFLKWGNMSRHLGFEGCKKIGELYKEMSEELFDVRFYTLQKDFDKVDIATLYDKIRYARFGNFKEICPTATSKALHLIAPDFFVMWDDPIRDFYGYTVNDSGKGYSHFIDNMKLWIDQLEPSITSLSKEFSKTKTKLIDEFNWYRLRPWWHKNEWSSI